MPPSPPKSSRRFDPYRASRTPAAATYVTELATQVNNLETLRGTRKRPRRAKEAATHARRIAAIATDLAHQHIAGRPALTVSRDTHITKSRYRSSVEGTQLPALLDLMASPELDLIQQTKGFPSQFGGMLTVIRPTPRLIRRIEESGLTFADLTRDAHDEEIVVLKDTRLTNAPATLFEYEDDEWTIRCRTEVRLINEHLSGARIAYHGDASTDDYVVDDTERRLKRRFTRSSFTSGGRLYGGFWLPLHKEQRLSNISINNESVVSLDFEAMQIMLAYATARAEPPAGDLYPTRVHVGDPSDPAPVHVPRQTMKKLMGACLFSMQPLKAWPRGLAGPRGVTVDAAVDALKRAHPATAPFFFMGLGHSLQFTESEILVDILLRLIAKGVTALPVHDCLVVAESDLDTAHRVMAEVFTFHTGLAARISIERATEQ
jgi:hypothetical protein